MHTTNNSSAKTSIQANTQVNGALVQKHSENAWSSLKKILDIVMYKRECTHTYVYAWLGKEDNDPNGTEIRRELNQFRQFLLIYLTSVHRSEHNAACMQTAFLLICTNTHRGKTPSLLRIPSDRWLCAPGDYLTRKKRLNLVSASPALVMGAFCDNKLNFENNWYLNFTNTLFS